MAADGTGKPLTAFIYDSLAWDYLSPFYIAQWGGEKELKGLIFEDGQVLVPCVIKKLYARWNDLCCYDGEKLMGIIDLYRMKCTAPLFDTIDMEPDTGLVTVVKDGVDGVLNDTTLQFVPMSDYDEENGNYLHEEFAKYFDHSIGVQTTVFCYVAQRVLTIYGKTFIMVNRSAGFVLNVERVLERYLLIGLGAFELRNGRQ